MKIEFKKITEKPKAFSLQTQGVIFEGEIKRVDQRLYRIQATLKGDIELVCDLSGEEYIESLDEDLVLHISNGFWDMQSQNRDFDVIEFFDGFVDFEYILQSEISSIQSQYHTKKGE